MRLLTLSFSLLTHNFEKWHIIICHCLLNGLLEWSAVFFYLTQEFELDPSLRHNMKLETTERIARVRLEMQWDKARLELAHHKLQVAFCHPLI